MKSHTDSAEESPHQTPSDLAEDALCALLIDSYAQETQNLLRSLEDQKSSFDPIIIRNLVRESTAQGHHPAQLVLGHEEADAYRAFLREEYQEEAPKHLKDSYFLGLQIIEEDVPTKLALAGEKSHDAWEAQLPPPWQDDIHPTPTPQAA